MPREVSTISEASRLSIGERQCSKLRVSPFAMYACANLLPSYVCVCSKRDLACRNLLVDRDRTLLSE
jgi:hypothetical protein